MHSGAGRLQAKVYGGMVAEGLVGGSRSSVLNLEILQAALLGLEAQRKRIDEQIAGVKAALGGERALLAPTSAQHPWLGKSGPCRPQRGSASPRRSRSGGRSSGRSRRRRNRCPAPAQREESSLDLVPRHDRSRSDLRARSAPGNCRRSVGPAAEVVAGDAPGTFVRIGSVATGLWAS